ncbi:unnamed protein product, partial [Arctogadus glacialis]
TPSPPQPIPTSSSLISPLLAPLCSPLGSIHLASPPLLLPSLAPWLPPPHQLPPAPPCSPARLSSH